MSVSLASEATPADLRGRYLAVFQCTFAFATVIAPGFFSILLMAGTPLASLALLGAAAMLVLRRLPRTALVSSPGGPTGCCPPGP